MQERMLELCGEGVRKYDLIRWNKLQERINHVREELRKMVAREAPYESLPATMLFMPNNRTVQWLNSFYQPTPSPAPPGSSSVAWIGTGVTNSIINILANRFTPGQSELLPLPQASIDANPNLTQDYGY
jgi:hypothetical protein